MARRTCPSQTVQHTSALQPFWKLRCRKNASGCGAKQISKPNCSKHAMFGPVFGPSDAVFRGGRRKGFCTLPKVNKTWGFCSIPKKDGKMGHLKTICKDTCCVAGAVQETCQLDGRDFLRQVAVWSTGSSGLLKWNCVTGTAPGMTWLHFFIAGAILSRHGLRKSKTH